MRNANPVQCAEEITRGERTRRGRDERVHLNPATLVTPTVQCSILIYLMIANLHIVLRTEQMTKDIQRSKEQ